MIKKIIVTAVVLAVTFAGGFTAGNNVGFDKGLSQTHLTEVTTPLNERFPMNVMHNINITDIDSQLKSGISPGNIAYAIEQQREALTARGIDVDALISHVWSGLETTPGQL